MRVDGRQNSQLRPTRIIPHYNMHAEGSVLIEVGQTKVICTASWEDRVPPFLKGSGKGWVTAEYGMLPRSTGTRNQREASKGKLGGRTMEIQRLIGRALRAVVDLGVMGENSITIDCDVIQADGGTRTASITGGFVAMALAMEKMLREGKLSRLPIKDHLAAISVGLVASQPLLDLNYLEDSEAEVDMNVVMTGSGRLVEVQGTGEEATFSRDQLNTMLDLATDGIQGMIAYQKEIIEPLGLRWLSK